MFGAGNEPSTVAEFEALYPLPYYAYNAGTLVNNKATAIESVGFNQWDEEWEEGNILDTGENYDDGSTRIRSKNYIRVFGGTQYYIECSKLFAVCIYDSSKKTLGWITSTSSIVSVQSFFNSIVVTLPKNTVYIRFVTANTYGTAYNHDICINISDPSRNGTYEPYEKHTYNLNLTTLTGKLNGEGESVVVFPDGMKSASRGYDEAYGRTGINKFLDVDMGTLDWIYQQSSGNMYVDNAIENRKVNGRAICSKYEKYSIEVGEVAGLTQDKSFAFQLTILKRIIVRDTAYSDAATFKAAMSGVHLIYEAEEPKVYVLDEELPAGYIEDGGGTEMVIPQSTASEVVAPLSIDMVYPLGAQQILTSLPVNYLSVASLDALLSTLGTACNGTFSKTWDSTNGKYTFSFIPNSQGE